MKTFAWHVMIAASVLVSLALLASPFGEAPRWARAQQRDAEADYADAIADIEEAKQAIEEEKATVLEESVNEDSDPLGNVSITPLPGGVLLTRGREQDVRRVIEIMQQQRQVANKGRFQIATWSYSYSQDNRGKYGFYVIDTATGEVWVANREGMPRKVMSGVLEAARE